MPRNANDEDAFRRFLGSVSFDTPVAIAPMEDDEEAESEDPADEETIIPEEET